MRNRPLRGVALALLVLAFLSGLGGASGAQGGELAQSRLLFLPLVGRTIDQPPPPQINAELTIRPVPLREVSQGEQQSVEYRYRNDGSAPLTARLNLFYPQRLLRFEQVAAPNDRYIYHDTFQVEVEVRNVAPGETRTGRIIFRVLANAPVGSKIGFYADYDCRTGQRCESNFAEVEVITGDTGSGGTFTMAVSPDRGPPGTAHTFSGAYFRPGERFVTWLNTPTGVVPLPITGNAGSNGRIQFTFGSGGLGQGFYSMVAHGQSSNVENVGPFVVQVNGQPPAIIAAGEPASTPPPHASAASEPAPAATGSGGISGHVRNGAGAGVGDVAVEVSDTSGNLVAVTRSRADGLYIIPYGLASGAYSVVAKPGVNPTLGFYASTTLGGVTVAEPDLTSGVNLTLPPAGGLRGRVTLGGSGAPGVRVTASAGNTLVAGTFTDATGAYTITNLSAGAYTLTFDPAGAARAAVYGRATSAAPGVVAGALAAVSTVNLAASNAVAAAGVISGRVSDTASGAGLEDVVVVITNDSPADGETFVSVAQTEADGTYTSDPLSGGSYRVQFVTLFSEAITTTRYIGEFYNDAATYAESDLVPLAVGQVAIADAQLTLGGSIAGTVSGAGAAGLADVLVIARDGAGVPRGLARTDADGTYTLRGLRPGGYRVEFTTGLSTNQATRAYADATYDANPGTPASDPVAVGAGQAVTGVNIALATGARIGGVVTATDSQAPLNQVIVAFLSAPLGGATTLAGISLTDAAGAYTSPGLAPGRYKILFTTIFSPDPTSRTYQDEFFENADSLDTATPVILGGANITRSASLAPGGLVSGRVSAQDSGAGLAGVFVRATVGGLPAASTITDENGAYTLEGVPAGQVSVSFTTARSPNLTTRGYVGSSLTVSVTSGQTTTGDIALASAP